MARWWKQVAEYTVVANAFNAEYGGFGSWFTTVTMKSGTNAVHGKVYDYFGNDKLNARSFFQGPVKQKLRQNEGGFQVGGPVYIPKIYDGRNKTFLFFGQGLYYARLGGAGGLQTVPRADFKTGNFSNFVDAAGAQIPIFDPADHAAGRQRQLRPHAVPGQYHSGQPHQPRLGEDRGAAAQSGSAASQTNNWYNRTGAFPFFNTFTSMAKLDHSVSTKQKIAVTYSESVASPSDQQQRLGEFRQRGARPSRRAGRTGGLPAPDRDQPDLAR